MIKLPAIATLVFPALLVAVCGAGRHHRDVDPARVDRMVTEHLEDYLDDVKASEPQKARILAVKNRLLPEGTALATSHQAVSKELAQQLASDKPDPARLHALVDQQFEATRAFAHKAVDGVVEAHGTLTPEQRAPLAKQLNRCASR
jgi:periplasmic protein CpxP/Spy